MKYFISIFAIFIGALFYYYYNYVFRVEYLLQDKRVLVSDGKDFLYKIKERDKNYFLATNEKIDNKNLSPELVSENEFWDPEECAQMLSVSSSENLYFFDTEFKNESTSDFVDIVYIYNLKDNTLQTFKSEQHKNIYSVIPSKEGVQVFYLDKEGNYYRALLKEDSHKLEFVDITKIKLDDIVYPELINIKTDLGDIKYYIVQ